MITFLKKFSHFVIVVSGPDYNFHLRKFEGNDLQLTLIYKLSLVIYINITDIYFSVFIFGGRGGRRILALREPMHVRFLNNNYNTD